MNKSMLLCHGVPGALQTRGMLFAKPNRQELNTLRSVKRTGGKKYSQQDEKHQLGFLSNSSPHPTSTPALTWADIFNLFPNGAVGGGGSQKEGHFL